MRVHVGPLPSAGVSEWIAFARRVLDEGPAGSGPVSTTLSDEVLTGFRDFLAQWERAATASDSFLWETDVDPEQAEFLAHAFFNVATQLEAAAVKRGRRLTPPAGELFYRAVIEAFLDAMTMENRSLAAYAEHLRTSWPGLALE